MATGFFAVLLLSCALSFLSVADGSNGGERRVVLLSPSEGQIFEIGEPVIVQFELQLPNPTRKCKITIGDEERQSTDRRLEWEGLVGGSHRVVVQCANSPSATVAANFIVNGPDFEESDAEMEMLASLSKTLVFGDGVEQEGGNILAREANIFIQAVNGAGRNITSSQHPNGVEILFDKDPINYSLTKRADGLVHAKFIWRYSGPTRITVNINGKPHLSSPWVVDVGERYDIMPGPEPVDPLPLPSPSSTRRFAYVTLVTTRSFVAGAVVVAHSLRHRGRAQQPMVALVVPRVDAASRHTLESAGWHVVEVPLIANPNAEHKVHFQDVYTKLHLWNMTQFDKVVFLDSDTMVLKPIEHLFDLPSGLHAATEINPPALFNAGVLVLEPSRVVFQDMLAKAPLIPAYDKTDQGFLNEYFMGAWKLLPYTYNLLKDRSALQERFQWFLDEKMHEIYVVHLTGEKPWQCYDDYHCNVMGRIAPELWNLWWTFLNAACDRGEVTCNKR